MPRTKQNHPKNLKGEQRSFAFLELLCSRGPACSGVAVRSGSPFFRRPRGGPCAAGVDGVLCRILMLHGSSSHILTLFLVKLTLLDYVEVKSGWVGFQARSLVFKCRRVSQVLVLLT